MKFQALMRVKIFLFLVLGLLILVYCAAQKKAEKKKAQKKEIILYGKVEVYSKDEVYIVSNWKSRSRISYRLTDKHNIKKLISKNGKILKVKALLLKMQSPWGGKIKILKIIEENSEKE